MELIKLRELVAFLREAGVCKYADDKIQLELVFDEYEIVEEDEVAAPAPERARAAVDPDVARILGSLPPDYAKAFDIKVRERK